jgi:hypothetical protein
VVVGPHQVPVLRLGYFIPAVRKLDLKTVKEGLQENRRLINLQLNPADLDENIRVTLEVRAAKYRLFN